MAAVALLLVACAAVQAHRAPGGRASPRDEAAAEAREGAPARRRPDAALARLDAAAGVLSKSVLPLKVTAHLDVDPDRDDFAGSARYELRVRRPVRSITLHARDLAVSDARLSSQRQAGTVDVDAQAQTVTFRFARPVPAGRHELSLRFAGRLHERGDGLYRVAATGRPDRRIVATEMEPTGARQMLPCFDEPAFRPVWQLAVTSDARHTVVSNMPAVRRADVGGGRQRTQFASTPPMASYLLALAIGEFDRVSARHDAVELSILVPPGEAAKGQQAMTWSQGLLRWFEDYFQQPYALPKLDQIAIPAKGLAMENWGLITYPESWILYDPANATADKDFYTHGILAHEIGHQWFGNLVTMAWWNDLWLNESFATWIALKATQALQPTWDIDTRRLGQRESAMSQDVLATARPMAREVARDSMALASFDRISYEKGSAVLGMIERAIGEDVFRDGLRRYMARHRMSNTVADDLWSALVEATQQRASAPVTAAGDARRGPGRTADLRGFMRAWSTQPGFALVDVAQRCDAGRGIVRVAQRRFALREGYVPDLRWPLSFELQAAGRVHRVETSGDPVEVDVGGCDDAVLADPGAQGYFRVRYDDVLASRLTERLAALEAIDQQRVLLDTWASAQAGQVPVQRVLALLERLPAQASSATWRMAVDVGMAMVDLMRDAPAHAVLRARVGKVLAERQRTLGWDPTPGEDATTRALRGDLVVALGEFDDAAVVASAQQRFADRERNPDGLRGDVGTAVLIVVGRHATLDTWDTLLAMLGEPRYAMSQAWALSRALVSPRDPAVARHAMQAALAGKLPRVLGNRIYGAVAAGGHEREAWSFVQGNRQRLFERSDDWSRRLLYPSILQRSRDMALAHEVHAAAQRDLPDDMREETKRALAQVERRAWAHDAVGRGLETATGVR